jgi:hypothetical protein
MIDEPPLPSEQREFPLDHKFNRWITGGIAANLSSDTLEDPGLWIRRDVHLTQRPVQDVKAIEVWTFLINVVFDHIRQPVEHGVVQIDRCGADVSRIKSGRKVMVPEVEEAE